jgi:hypothetical protein
MGELRRSAIAARERLAALCVAGLICAAAVPAAASASAMHRTRVARPEKLTLKFTRLGAGAVFGDGRYVLAFGNDTGYPSGEQGVLVDGLTGQQTAISEPCASASAIGAGSIVFSCDFGYWLYSIASGQMRPLPVSPSVFVSSCLGSENGPLQCALATSVGVDWVAFETPCGQEHCGPPAYGFQNLATGDTASDPTTTHTMVDLDAASLQRHLCGGVTVPSWPYPYSYEGGVPSVTVDGRFAVATSPGGSYLERCATKLHEFLTYTAYPGCPHGACGPPVNSSEIVWESKPLQLSGIFLPSLRRFTITLPAMIDPTPGLYVNGDQYTLALTKNSVYVGNDDQVWQARIPTSPSRR